MLGSAALSIGSHSLLSAAPPSDESLDLLWATAIDGMFNVPGCESLSSPDGMLYLVPASSKEGGKPPAAWPKVFSKGVVFSLTASNPMGIEATSEQNREANERLQEDILLLERSATTCPRAWWHSFGFNVKEGWREDGFSIAYANEERGFASKRFPSRVEPETRTSAPPCTHPSLNL